MHPQYVYCKAFNSTGPVTGDAANITGKIAIDAGSLTALDDTSAEHVGNGVYRFALTTIERTGTSFVFDFQSSTSGVNVLRMDPAITATTTTVHATTGNPGAY